MKRILFFQDKEAKSVRIFVSKLETQPLIELTEGSGEYKSAADKVFSMLRIATKEEPFYMQHKNYRILKGISNQKDVADRDMTFVYILGDAYRIENVKNQLDTDLKVGGLTASSETKQYIENEIAQIKKKKTMAIIAIAVVIIVLISSIL